MAKRRTILSENSIASKVKSGCGSGEGKNYKPWIEIHDFPSLGRVSRVFGWKTGRIHHFMSDNETRYFYLLEWSGIVTDIREQYPILEREKTIEIANRKHIRHPAESQTRTPAVLTSDFMITISINGKMSNIVRTVKPAVKLENKRTNEKLEIERQYWQDQNTDWGIITDKDIPRQLAENIGSIHSYYRIEDLGFEDAGHLTERIIFLKEHLNDSPDNLLTLLNSLDNKTGTEPGTYLKIFKHLIATKQVGIDMNTRLDFNVPVRNIIKSSNIGNFRERLA